MPNSFVEFFRGCCCCPCLNKPQVEDEESDERRLLKVVYQLDSNEGDPLRNNNFSDSEKNRIRREFRAAQKNMTARRSRQSQSLGTGTFPNAWTRSSFRPNTSLSLGSVKDDARRIVSKMAKNVKEGKVRVPEQYQFVDQATDRCRRNSEGRLICRR